MKFTLTGTDNDGFRHRYSVRKNEAFRKAFLKFMEDLGFDSDGIDKQTFYFQDDPGNYHRLKVSELQDCIRHYQNSKYDVDVFFGKAKIIIVVRTKKRVPVVKHLENKAGWVKPLKIKKISGRERLKVKIPIKKRK